METHWKRNIAIFLSTQAISLFGSALVHYAITWHITLTTQSGSMMALTVLCGVLPTVLISPFGGVWADRYDRRLLIVVADGLIALCTWMLAIAFHLGYGSVWLLFAASAVRALGAGVQMPAVNALLPRFVSEAQLTRVNAVHGTIQSMMTLLSPMASATLLSFASLEAIFLVDVVTGAIAVVVLLVALRVPAHLRAGATEAVGYFSDVREGLLYIRRHAYLKAFFLFSGLLFVLTGPQAFLSPLQVARTYGGEVWRLSAIEVGFSLGMVLGGVVVAAWGGFRNKVHSLALANFLIGLGGVIFGIGPPFVLYVAAMVMIGFILPLFQTSATVLLQQRVEDAFRGRIFGVNSMIYSSVVPLSMLIYGPLADMVPLETMMLVTGLLSVLQTAFMLANRPLRDAGEPLPGAPAAPSA